MAYALILGVLLFFAGLVAIGVFALAVAISSFRVRTTRGALVALGLSLCAFADLAVFSRISRLPPSDPWNRYFAWVQLCCWIAAVCATIAFFYTRWQKRRKSVRPITDAHSTRGF